MAAYGVIGGAIGGAIAIALGVWLKKRLIKRDKGKKSPIGIVSYKPFWSALFLFLLSIGDVVFCLYGIWWTITENFIWYYHVAYIFLFLDGLLIGCWSGSFLNAKITISKDRLIIDHTAKMPITGEHIHLWQLGRHHLDVSWSEIHEIRADVNWMRVNLHNGECYTFPIGWCKEKARLAIARHKPIKSWT